MTEAVQRQTLRPGQKAPVSGAYQRIGPRGGKGNVVVVTEGGALPPTPRRGMRYRFLKANSVVRGGDRQVIFADVDVTGESTKWLSSKRQLRQALERAAARAG